MPRASSTSIRALHGATLAMLQQKTGFINLLKNRFGAGQSKQLYQQVCPIVGASIGQHIRHSMDHMELAIRMAGEYPNINNDEFHYDLRTRGGNDENDIDAAFHRIDSLSDFLLEEKENEGSALVESRPVDAFFMLTGDPTEFKVSTTTERELAFSVHHAIHHMAMVKIIAVQSLEIGNDDLPPDFGRAPSTVAHDKGMI
ncbi:unnamed protein product [Cylindrotheca closterium]|uniref:DinB-like domain-containing protein n=1 Tax=Cylindrotheca closterium TaxID=2856 RepID=A0AAD2CGN6_9STRA|nr:unnamed protein product [Cylindrotheca closterium]